MTKLTNKEISDIFRDAPLNATHYDPEVSRFIKIESYGGTIEKWIPRPVYTQQMKDDGELPGAGMWGLYGIEGSILRKAVVRYVGSKYIVLTDDDGGELVIVIKEDSFKPLETDKEKIVIEDGFYIWEPLDIRTMSCKMSCSPLLCNQVVRVIEGEVFLSGRFKEYSIDTALKYGKFGECVLKE